jgi:murein L,D-transpeptidase YafK
MRSRQSSRQSLRINAFALVALALAFMLLPALFAFAQAVPETARSKAAVERHEMALKRDLAPAGFAADAEVYFQIIKADETMTAYVEGADGTYRAFRSWPICRYSGGLGPKRREGDGKSPEGIYRVAPPAMNPASSYHLSFNLGFPNVYDRAQGYTGSYLMVHGACVSIGCYAMTDDGIEEIWTLMQIAFEGGQRSVPVHIFPFEMTDENMALALGHEDYAFWQELAPIWAAFEASGAVPDVRVQAGRYVLPAYQ